MVILCTCIILCHLVTNPYTHSACKTLQKFVHIHNNFVVYGIIQDLWGDPSSWFDIVYLIQTKRGM